MNNIKATEGYEDMFEDIVEFEGEYKYRVGDRFILNPLGINRTKLLIVSECYSKNSEPMYEIHNFDTGDLFSVATESEINDKLVYKGNQDEKGDDNWFDDIDQQYKHGEIELLDSQKIIDHLREIIKLPGKITRLELVLELDEVLRLTVESHVEGYDCINAT